MKGTMKAVRPSYLHLSNILSGRVELSGQASQPDPTLFQKNSNPTRRGQSNSVAETVNCKQLISHVIVKVLIIYETTYNFSSKFIVKLKRVRTKCQIRKAIISGMRHVY